jgi:hypothetical protein
MSFVPTIQRRPMTELGEAFAAQGATLPTEDVLGAAFQKQFENNIFYDAGIWAVRQENWFGEQSRKLVAGGMDLGRELDPDEANKLYGGRGLTFDKPIRERAAALLAQRHKDDREYEQIMAAGGGGFVEGTGKFAAQVGATVLDPVEFALNFLPVTWAARSARAGRFLDAAAMSERYLGKSFGQRAAMRLGEGAMEGAAGGAVSGAATWGFMSDEQKDFSMGDFLAGIVMAASAGSVLHTAIGGVGDLARPRGEFSPIPLTPHDAGRWMGAGGDFDRMLATNDSVVARELTEGRTLSADERVAHLKESPTSAMPDDLAKAVAAEKQRRTQGFNDADRAADAQRATAVEITTKEPADSTGARLAEVNRPDAELKAYEADVNAKEQELKDWEAGTQNRMTEQVRRHTASWRDVQVELKSKADVVDREAATGKTVKGFADAGAGKVTIVPENIKTSLDLAESLNHEGFHIGFARTLGKNEKAYQKFADDLLPRIQEIDADGLAQVKGLYGEKADSATLVEEYMAKLAQSGDVDSSLWRDFVSQLKQWLSDVFPSAVKWNEKDMVALIGRAGRALQEGGPGRIDTNGRTRYSLGDESKPAAGDSGRQKAGAASGTSFEDAAAHIRASTGADAEFSKRPFTERRDAEASSLVDWAKKNGKVLPDSFFEGQNLFSEGTAEHKVYLGADGLVYKQTNGGFYGQVPVIMGDRLERLPGTPFDYLRRQELQKTVFHDELDFKGVINSKSLVIGEKDYPAFVITQKFKAAFDPKNPKPSVPDIDKFMGDRGFQKVPGSATGTSWYRAKDGVLVGDAKADNFVQTGQGADGVVPIDLQMSQVDPRKLPASWPKEKFSLGDNSESRGMFDDFLKELGFDEKGSLEGLNKQIESALTPLEKMALLQKKREAILNKLASSKIEEYVARFPNAYEGMSAYLMGTNTVRSGSRLGVAQTQMAVNRRYVSALVSKLQKQNLMPLFMAKESERDIMRELWRVGRSEEEASSMPPASRAEFRQVAEVIAGVRRDLIGRANRSGAYIKDLPGYLFRQSHDMGKVKGAGYQAWRDFISNKLDWDLIEHQQLTEGMTPEQQSFAQASGDLPAFDRESFLRGAWEGIASGVHLRPDGMDQPVSGFRMPRNEAARVSASRKLHFKDADSFGDYNDRFGSGNLRDSVFRGIQGLTESTALMEAFGANPQAMFDQVMKGIRETGRMTRGADTGRQEKILRQHFEFLSGADRIAGNVTMARISGQIRAVNNMASLGAVLISSISDMGGKFMEFRYQGIPALSALEDMTFGLVKNTFEGEAREIATAMGAGLEGTLGDVLHRIDPSDPVGGGLGTAQKWFFKATGLEWWTDAQKRGAARTMSAFLGGMHENTWATLPTETQRVLTLFEIGNKEWDAMRGLAHEAEDGRFYVLPERVRDMADGDVRKLMKADGINTTGKDALAKYRDTLETKWMAYFTDRVDYAVLTPGAMERSLMKFGTKPGTVLGETVRMMGQFKSFGLSFMTKSMGREFYGRTGSGRWGGLAMLAATTTALGYAALQLSELANGKSPRPANWKTMQAAIIKGGGMGMLTDWIFGEYNAGRSFVDAMAGPTFSRINALDDIRSRIIEGKDAGAQSAKVIRSLIPGNNLIGAKLMLDYGVMYQLQEALSPGYLKRLEKQAEKNGQEFLVPLPNKR